MHHLSRMSRTRIVIVALVALAAISVLLVFTIGRLGAGSAYEGKRLAAWLATYCAASARYSSPSNVQKSTEAFRALGTNAIAYLVEAACATDASPTRTEVTTLLQRELRWNGVSKSISQVGSYLFNTRPKPTLDPESFRTWSRQALADIPAKSAELLPWLQPKLTDSRTEVRQHAIRLVGNGIVSPDQAAPFLLGAIRDADPKIRLEAIRAAGSSRLKHPEFQQELTRLFDQAPKAERQQLVFALTTGNPEAPEALPLLLRLLADSQARERFVIADAIWRVEPGHPQALKILQTEILNGPNDRAAVCLLAATTPPYRLPEKFFSPSVFGPPMLRQSLIGSMEQLVAIGMPKKQAIAILERALQMNPNFFRYSLAKSLSKLDPGSTKAVAALVSVVQMANLPPDFQRLVIQDLAVYGAAASNAVPVLNGLLPGARPDVAAQISFTIRQIQSAQPKPNSPSAP